MDNIVGKITVKGVEYDEYVGTKGGHYYINAKGKKVYLKEQAQPVTEKVINVVKPKESKLTRYIGYFRQLDKEGCAVDDFKEWCEAYSEDEARRKFEDDYRDSIARGTIELSMILEE